MSLLNKIKNWLGLGDKSIMEVKNVVPKDDYTYNEMQFKKEKQVDFLLDKINKKGIKSLTKKEKEFLYRESKG